MWHLYTSYFLCGDWEIAGLAGVDLKSLSVHLTSTSGAHHLNNTGKIAKEPEQYGLLCDIQMVRNLFS